MRDDFAIFILTHGRADNVVTMKTLQRIGYKGKWFMVIDDEDKQASLYKKIYGQDRVIVFNKAEAVERADTMDNFKQHKAILYARNESFRIAKALGLTYFLMLDDDYSSFMYRYARNGKLLSKQLTAKTFERIIDLMIEFLDASQAKTIAFSQGGDLIGGVNQNFQKGLLRKAMNSFFCRTDRPIEFRGTMNEDVTTYTTLGSRGDLFFTFMGVQIVQLATQSLAGGMTAVYRDGGTYLKSFYSVLSMPSSVHVGIMYAKNERIHHNVSWNQTVPKIIKEDCKKYD